MRKINDKELLYMIDKNTPQKDMAAHFGVSDAAISKRLKRLRQIATRPAILDKLTDKEQRFVAEIVSGKNQTQAALSAFNVGSMDSAKTIGCRLAKDPEIQGAITAVLESEGLSRRYLVRKLKNHVEGIDPNVSLRALDIGLKLHDAYPATTTKNLNINATLDIDPVNMEKYR